MFKTAPRVREISTTTGAGTYTLSGAPTGFQPFSVLGASNLCPYFATDGTGWEEGIGTVLTGPARLERTTILGSSNGGAAVNWGAGTRTLRVGPLGALALPRMLSKSVAGGLNVTLTQDEQRREILVFTGALTANINVIVDDTPWQWIVFNNTTGAFSLTIKTAAGTGISVAQGKRSILHGDGVNAQRATDEHLLISGGTLTGPLTLAADPKAALHAVAARNLTKAIFGLTYDNGTDALNDLNINVGGAMDATGAYWMTLATALGKQSDVAWAVGGTPGAPAGGLDTGVVGNSDYYVWLIARSDTGVVDALFSLSSTAPTMPENYDFKRLIGWFKRQAGGVLAFTTYETEGGGIEFLWPFPATDINLLNTLTTSRRTDAVRVPLNFSVTAILNAGIADVGAAIAYIYCPDQADLSPSTTAGPMYTIASNAGADGGGLLRVRTSATGTIAARSTTATVDKYVVATIGFTWARRN